MCFDWTVIVICGPHCNPAKGSSTNKWCNYKNLMWESEESQSRGEASRVFWCCCIFSVAFVFVRVTGIWTDTDLNSLVPDSRHAGRQAGSRWNCQTNREAAVRHGEQKRQRFTDIGKNNFSHRTNATDAKILAWSFAPANLTAHLQECVSESCVAASKHPGTTGIQSFDVTPHTVCQSASLIQSSLFLPDLMNSNVLNLRQDLV